MLLKTQLFCCLYMTGLIWFVQLVHYPLLAKVGPDVFMDYEKEHMKWTTVVVGPIMILEALTASGLVWLNPSNTLLWINALGLAFIFGWTFFLSAPYHTQLSEGFDMRVHHKLVLTNWMRTLLWSLRSLFLLSYGVPS